MPSYFDNQALGTSTKINLPSIRFTPKLLGFAACIVIACKTPIHIQFPAFIYSWICEANGVIRINLQPTDYYSPRFGEKETVTLHHLVIIYVPNSINTEEFDELQFESHLQLPDEYYYGFPRGEIRACGVRMISGDWIKSQKKKKSAYTKM